MEEQIKDKELLNIFSENVVIVCGSIVEALLLFLVNDKFKDIDSFKIKGKELIVIEDYNFNYKKNKLFICKKIDKKIKKKEVNFNFAINILLSDKIIEGQKPIIKKETGDKLNELRKLRNKIHLTSRDGKEITVRDVKKAIELTVYVIKNLEKRCRKT